MTKTLNTQDEGKKQKKREAKILLEVEEARKEVKKAEQKLAKAQSNLEASRIRLQKLEEGFAQICKKHPEQPESPVVTIPAEQPYEHPQEIKVPDQGESYEDGEAVEELHQSSPPPVEGRSDIAQ